MRAVEQNAAARGLVLAEHSDHAPLDLDVRGGDNDGFHLGVCRLQADLVRSFLEEALQRGFCSADQRNYDVTILGRVGGFYKDVVAIADVIVHHGITLHSQYINLSFAAGEIAERKVFGLRNRFHRLARRNTAEQRELEVGYRLEVNGLGGICAG